MAKADKTPFRQQTDLAKASTFETKNREYKKLQEWLRQKAFTLDERFNTLYTDYTKVPSVWESRPINDVDAELRQELRHLEEVRFKAEEYKNFSLTARDCMARRIAIRDDGDILLTWFGDGMDESAVARTLGFPSVRLMRSWMEKSDKLCGTTLLDTYYAGVEGRGYDYMRRAESLISKIGEVELPQGVMSAAKLAADFQTAAINGNEADKFSLQQLSPLLEAALKWDAAKKTALAKHFEMRAAHCSQDYRRDAAKHTAVAVTGGISITMDLGLRPEDAKPRVVNKDDVASGSTLVEGITLDME